MRSSTCFVPSLMLLLAACAGGARHPAPVSRAPAAGVKVGKPYVVMGKTYVPHDDRGYDRRGIASWYGPTFHTRPTANGEIYNQNDVTAAHKTLPMPSWVEVTNLDNGRKLVVRINDRGPFVDGRIIDLSLRSAQLLGVDRVGLANVRVRRVFPDGDWARAQPPLSPQVERAPASAPLAVAAGTAPLAIAAGTPAPPPAAHLPAPPAVARASAAAGAFVQVAAVSDQGKAEWLAQNLALFGPAAATPAGNGLWRVRLGPFSPSAAEETLGEIRAAGYGDAQLVHAP